MNAATAAIGRSSKSRSTNRLATTLRPTFWQFLKTRSTRTLDDEHDNEHTGEDDQIDDPVRIYLMQMGEIPMLSRQEETSVAKRIDRSRRGFRYSMLATDYILQAAIGLLESIRDNKLRLDRTIEVSVINLGEKARLLKVLTPNLRTLHHLMLQNKRDFALAIDRRQPAKHRRRPGGGC